MVKEQGKGKKGTNQEVPALHSIKAKIGFLTLVMVLIALILNVWTVVPNVKKNISGIAKNYLFDSAVFSGRLIDEACTLSSAEQMLTSAALGDIIGEAGMEGIESSYAYVVDLSGMMLYHPTAEKIGQKVENAVVTSLVADLSAGKHLENDVVEYEFGGKKNMPHTISAHMPILCLSLAQTKPKY